MLCELYSGNKYLGLVWIAPKAPKVCINTLVLKKKETQ